MSSSDGTPDTEAVEIHLAARPSGLPRLEHFAFVRGAVPEPADGQFLVRNRLLSIDPYMWGRMDGTTKYADAYRVGEVMHGAAIGEVVASRSPAVRPGDLVSHRLGWRTHAVLRAEDATKIDPGVAPPEAYLGVLGLPGLTAYAGLVHVGRFRPGDTVFVSAAAGAVGSLVGQLAKSRGARCVIGSAGSARKVRYLTEELGFDEAFNYRDAPPSAQLAAAAPDGIDLYFDNVGGDHLTAAITQIREHGRIVVCGTISTHADHKAPRYDLSQIVDKRFLIRGLLVRDHLDRKAEFDATIVPLLRSGVIRRPETVVREIVNAPQAFLDMLAGRNIGKTLVQL